MPSHSSTRRGSVLKIISFLLSYVIFITCIFYIFDSSHLDVLLTAISDGLPMDARCAEEQEEELEEELEEERKRAKKNKGEHNNSSNHDDG